MDQMILEEEFNKLAEGRTGKLGVSFEAFLESEDIKSMLAEDSTMLEGRRRTRVGE